MLPWVNNKQATRWSVEISIGVSKQLGRTVNCTRGFGIIEKIKYRQGNGHLKCLIRSIHSYSAESWTTYAYHFHRKSLLLSGKIMLRNVDFLAKSNQKCIEIIVGMKRLKWLRHVERIDDQRIPKQLLNSESEI